MKRRNRLPFTFGALIRWVRLKQCMSTYALSKNAHISHSMILNIENSSSIPRNQTIARLAIGLGTKPSTLWNVYHGVGTQRAWNVRLKDAVLNANLSDTQASRKCHISAYRFKRLLAGTIYPSPKNLVNIGYGLSLKIDTLFKESKYYDPDYMNTFGYWLLKVENQPNWSQGKLAKRLGCTRQNLRNYVNNVSMPTPELIRRIKIILSQ